MIGEFMLRHPPDQLKVLGRIERHGLGFLGPTLLMGSMVRREL
jgi:hypothetical protein